MTLVTDNGWSLHYTIGRELAAQVMQNDVVHLPCGQGSFTVLGGQGPQRVNDSGCVFVHDPTARTNDRLEARPGALGMVWISAAGGWSELPA